MKRLLLTAVTVVILSYSTVYAEPVKFEPQTIQVNNTAAKDNIIQKPDVGVKAAPMNTQQASTNIQGQQLAKQAINNNPEANKGILETIKDGVKRLQQSMAESNQKIKDMQIKSRENAERMKQMNDDAKANQERASEQFHRQQEEQKRIMDLQRSNQGGFRK